MNKAMTGKTSAYSYLISFVLAGFLLILFIVFFPLGGKYKLSLVSALPMSTNNIEVYHDIDHDGNSEYFRFYKDFEGVPSVITEQNGVILHQWNLNGNFTRGAFYCIGDYNADGIDELFVFTYHSDSIFLNGYNIKANQPLMEELYISTFRYHNKVIDFGVNEPELVNLDHSGQKKLLLSLYCSFSYTARKQCLIDLDTRDVRISPVSGTTISRQRFLFDLDQDGKMEISGCIPVRGNTPKEYPFTDQLGWLFVYDHELNFKFHPPNVNQYSGEIWVRPLVTETGNLLAVGSINTTNTDSCFIGLYTSQGKLVRSRKFIDDNTLQSAFFKTFPEKTPHRIALYRSNGKVEIFDEQLNLIKTFNSLPIRLDLWNIDLDEDGTTEELFWSADYDKLIITRNDLSDAVGIDVNAYDSAENYFSLIKAKGTVPLLFLSAEKSKYTFSYQKNWLYTFRFLVWGGCFLLLFLLVHGIGKLYQSILKRRYDAETQIRMYQVKGIEQQLNPHFTLNILNDIGALYEKHETDTAQYYFGKYGKLLKNILLQSGQISTTLASELEFVRSFIELEQFRLNHAFQFRMDISADLSTIPVPRLLVHTFAENAIRHGIRPILHEKTCTLSITAKHHSQEIQLTIEDDGIGRRNSRSGKATTGKGIEIVKDMLKLYELLEGRQIRLKITDLVNNSPYTGTCVAITIPS
ncbi:MAG: sensor histidine kinase [Mangrovibacterium sp.]